MLRLEVYPQTPAVAGRGPDDGLLHTGLAHQLLGFLAVLLGPLLEVQVVEQAHNGPELRLVPVAQFTGVPAHDVLHRDGMAEMEGLLVVPGQQVPGLRTGYGHGNLSLLFCRGGHCLPAPLPRCFI